jgi:hypothetical protein
MIIKAAGLKVLITVVEGTEVIIVIVGYKSK